MAKPTIRPELPNDWSTADAPAIIPKGLWDVVLFSHDASMRLAEVIAKVSRLNHAVSGKKIGAQAFGILPRIGAVDRLMTRNCNRTSMRVIQRCRSRLQRVVPCGSTRSGRTEKRSAWLSWRSTVSASIPTPSAVASARAGWNGMTSSTRR